MSVADRLAAAPIIIAGEVCRDFERASRLEWLETNHTGGYAMGTVAGVNTRRDHSLLLASLRPPAGRYSILSRVEERVTLDLDGAVFELGTVQYPGVVQPHGFDLLEEFRLDPFPIWRYRAQDAIVKKPSACWTGSKASSSATLAQSANAFDLLSICRITRKPLK